MDEVPWDEAGWEARRRARLGVRGFPEPETMRKGVAGVCKWGCGRPVEKPALYWHKACFEEYCLHTRAESQKAWLVERRGRICEICKTVEPMKWLGSPGRNEGYRPDQAMYWGTPEEQEAWRAERWPFPDRRWSDLSPEERIVGETTAIERVCALEVDHRVPLWEVADLPDDERRWYFGPGNLWLLCPRCHKLKTKREAARRAHERRMAKAQLALPISPAP